MRSTIYFARQDSIEAQWRIVEPVLRNATPLHEYPVGSWGPAEADRLIARDGGWINPEALDPSEPPRTLRRGADLVKAS